MSRHVVRPFGRVGEDRIAVRYRARHECFQIATYGRVGVFTQHQRGAGVMNENVAQAARNTAVGNATLHVVRDLVSTSPGSGDLKGVLVEHFQGVSSC